MLASGQRSSDLIQKGAAQNLSLTVYSSATLTVASGTVSVYDPTGTAIVDAATITATGATASYTLAGTEFADSTIGGGYREEWALVLSDGSTPTFIRPAILCRLPIYPTVTPDDLVAVNAQLPGVGTFTFGNTTTTWPVWSWAKLDVCWGEVLRSLEQMGRLPDRIVSLPLHDYHRTLTLWRMYRELRQQAGDLYDTEMRDTESELRRLKAGAILSYDLSGDGIVDTTINGVGGAVARLGWPWGLAMGAP
jgi:hypothetical protein